MAEEQSTVDTLETTEVLPPEGTEDVGRSVFELLETVVSDKDARNLPKKWTRNYELTRGKHWKRKPNKKVSLISANVIHTHRGRTVNLLTDNNPTFNIRKFGRQGEGEVYEALLHTCEFWWNDQEQQPILEQSVLNGETYGCTIEKIVFNSELEHGFGEVETELVDPFYFGIYPTNEKDNQKAEANLHFYPMTVRKAKRMWPDMADQIVSDKEVLESLGDDREEMATGKSDRGFLGTISSVIKTFTTDADKQRRDDDAKTLIVECWVRDYSTETVEEEILGDVIDESTGQPIEDPDNSGQVLQEVIETREVTRPKYPGNIRVVTACNAGKVVLEDMGNPNINPLLPQDQAMQTYLWDKFPFTLTQSVTDTTDPWGMSDIEQLDTLQMEINKSISQFTMVKDKAARVKLINPKNSGVQNNEFDNIPGIINPSNEMVAQAIRYMDPPQVPVDIVNALSMYKELFFLVAGTFDLDQAQESGKDVIAYKAIAALIERASTMLKGKLRNYGKMIRERGKMYLSHVMNWYTEDRWISYEEGGEEVSMQINGQNLIAPAKLVVVSGSTMPISKIQEREEALALFQMGAIDLEELLKKIEWPDRKQVVARLHAGPIGLFIDRLTKMGLPPQFAQILQEIGQMDDKVFEKMLKNGELPSIPNLIRAYLESGGDFSTPPTVKEQLEHEELKANIQKTYAETALINAKIATEGTEQDVKRAGMGFDEKKLRLEEAEVINSIQESIERLRLDVQDLALSKQLEAEKIKTDREKAKKTESTTSSPSKPSSKSNRSVTRKTSSAKKRRQGPYNEKGLKSNNKS
jgi:hypothetical protein